jgi:hypothetical protein
MTLQELGAKLNELENIRTTAEQELIALKTHQRRMDELEKDCVALLESMAQKVPEALNSLTGEERNRIYRMLRLEISPVSAGYEVRGAFCTFETRWAAGFKSTKQPAELRFYTLLNEEAPEVSWQWGDTAGAAKKRRSSSLGRS